MLNQNHLKINTNFEPEREYFPFSEELIRKKIYDLKSSGEIIDNLFLLIDSLPFSHSIERMNKNIKTLKIPSTWMHRLFSRSFQLKVLYSNEVDAEVIIMENIHICVDTLGSYPLALLMLESFYLTYKEAGYYDK